MHFVCTIFANKINVKNYFRNSVRSVIFPLHNFHEAQLFLSIFPVSVYVCVASSFQTLEFFMECKLKSFFSSFVAAHTLVLQRNLLKNEIDTYSVLPEERTRTHEKTTTEANTGKTMTANDSKANAERLNELRKFSPHLFGEELSKSGRAMKSENKRKIFRSFPSLYAAVNRTISRRPHVYILCMRC